MNKTKKIQDIETLRALAIILVLIQHSQGLLFTWIPAIDSTKKFSFAVGVDIFFAVSGFVIANSLLPLLENTENKLEIARTILIFWLRRAWRLWPSAWAWLMIIIFCSQFANTGNEFGPPEKNIEAAIAGILQVANFRAYDTFFRGQYYGVSFYYWSLSLEEQFYILLPLLAFIFRGWLWICLFLIVVLRFYMNEHMSLFRIEGMAIGVLVAIARRAKGAPVFEPHFLERGWITLSIVIFMLTAIIMLGGSSHRIAPISPALIALISGSLVFAAAYNRNYFQLPSPLQATTLWLGARSYSLYLCHVPAYLITREIWHRTGTTVPSENTFLAFGLSAIVLVILFSECTYRWIESPFRRRGRDLTEKMRGSKADALQQNSQPSLSPTKST